MRRHYLEDVAELGPPVLDAIRFHNPDATYATRGCNKRCAFCNVWMIDGTFSYFPDFAIRPILCDANIAGLDARYQDFIVERYRAAGPPRLECPAAYRRGALGQSAHLALRPLS
jgi:hypothetical protein